MSDFTDNLKTLRAGLEQALAGAEAAFEIPHVAGDPTSGGTELQRNRLFQIRTVLDRLLEDGGHVATVEHAQGQRDVMPA